MVEIIVVLFFYSILGILIANEVKSNLDEYKFRWWHPILVLLAFLLPIVFIIISLLSFIFSVLFYWK